MTGKTSSFFNNEIYKIIIKYGKKICDTFNPDMYDTCEEFITAVNRYRLPTIIPSYKKITSSHEIFVDQFREEMRDFYKDNRELIDNNLKNKNGLLFHLGDMQFLNKYLLFFNVILFPVDIWGDDTYITHDYKWKMFCFVPIYYYAIKFKSFLICEYSDPQLLFCPILQKEIDDNSFSTSTNVAFNFFNYISKAHIDTVGYSYTYLRDFNKSVNIDELIQGLNLKKIYQNDAVASLIRHVKIRALTKDDFNTLLTFASERALSLYNSESIAFELHADIALTNRFHTFYKIRNFGLEDSAHLHNYVRETEILSTSIDTQFNWLNELSIEDCFRIINSGYFDEFIRNIQILRQNYSYTTPQEYELASSQFANEIKNLIINESKRIAKDLEILKKKYFRSMVSLSAATLMTIGSFVYLPLSFASAMWGLGYGAKSIKDVLEIKHNIDNLKESLEYRPSHILIKYIDQ